MDLDDIELYYNLEFEPEIKEKHKHIIIDLFNNMCPNNYQDSKDVDIMRIVAIYYISQNKIDKAINILKEINNNDAYCTLGILYNILDDKEKSIYYFKLGAINNHILSSVNLAFEYLCQGEIDLFLQYNKIGVDTNNENALINLGIYYWNIKKEYLNSVNIFNLLFLNNNYRAYYEYAKLIPDKNEKKMYLLKALKLKIKKTYIDMLIKLTGDYERYMFYIKNNIDINKIINIDILISNVHLNSFYELHNISKYNRCPSCIIDEKKELFKLKCNHSFCNNCIIKYCKNKCSICYK